MLPPLKAELVRRIHRGSRLDKGTDGKGVKGASGACWRQLDARVMTVMLTCRVDGHAKDCYRPLEGDRRLALIDRITFVV